MRLLFITNVFPNPYQPTKGVFNLELARALVQDHQVKVVAPILWTDEWKAARTGLLNRERFQVVDGLEVHFPRYYYPPKILRSYYGWFFWQSVRPTLKRIVESFRPDAILGYWAHPDGQTAVRLARALQVPVVIMVGGTDVLLLTENWRRRRCVLRVLHEADAVVTTSQDLRGKLLGFGLPPEKVHVSHRGVNSTLFFPGGKPEARRRLGIPTETRMLIWVGRMIPVKGLDVLLEACSRLRVRDTKFHLYLVGDGPLRNALTREARRCGLADMVTFVGSVAYDKLPDWYRAADLTVLPSRSEGVPNVLRESLACGTPFVASRVGGIAEIAHDPANELVIPDDPQALAEAIARGLVTPPAAKPPMFQSCGWGESAESLLRLLRSLLKKQERLPASGKGNLLAVS